MREGQNITVRRGQDLTLRFTCTDASGASEAYWYVGKTSETPIAERTVWSSTSGGITMTPNGDDMIVSVALTRVQTEALAVGRLFHQLWLIDGVGNLVPNAEGTLTVKDSLRN